MQISSSFSLPLPDLHGRVRSPIVVIVGVLVTVAIMAVASIIVFEVANQGRIYRGVHIAGVDVSHVRTSDALKRLARRQQGLDVAQVVVAHWWSSMAATWRRHWSAL